ncbi:MAG: hypothetical protein ABIT10_05620 [Alteraurantiacibacter sp.]
MSPAARAAYRQFREAEAHNQAQLSAARAANTVPAWVDDEDDYSAAEADYAEWFTPDRRARVWQTIDMVFGASEDAEEDADAD